MKKLLVILSGIILFSCTKNPSTEKYQTDRDNVENVHSRIKEFETDSVLIGNNARIYINVSSTNSKQCKLCVNSSRNIDTRLLRKTAICCNCTQ